MRILLVNPYLADFAAYNFWVKPLGLYNVAEWLAERSVDVVMLDALSGFKAPAKFDRHPLPLPSHINLPAMDRRFAIYGMNQGLFTAKLTEIGHVDAILLTSGMSYWYPGVKRTVELTRDVLPHTPIGIGGIYATLWANHAKYHSGADQVFEGPLTQCGDLLCKWLDISLEPQQPKRRWYELGLYDKALFAGIRTATGCPFKCTYCASRLVSGDFMERNVNEILCEILELYKMGVRDFSFYDDALLVNFDERIGKILKIIHQKCINARFHTPNGLHARLITKEVARLLVASNFKTIRLSLETVDIKRQIETGAKVSCVDLEQAVKELVAAGMDAQNIGVYLLAGLLGQEMEELEEGIKFVKSLGATPYLAEFSPIPGTKEWQKLEKAGLVSGQTDPFYTNNTIFYWHSLGWDRERFREIKKMAAGS